MFDSQWKAHMHEAVEASGKALDSDVLLSFGTGAYVLRTPVLATSYLQNRLSIQAP